MKVSSDDIYRRANKLLAGSRSLNYKGIIKGDSTAVAQLNTVLASLNSHDNPQSQSLDHYAKPQIVNNCTQKIAV